MTGQPPQLRVAVEPRMVEVRPGATAGATVHLTSTAAEPLVVTVDVIGAQASWCAPTVPRIELGPRGSEAIDVEVRVPERLAAHPGVVVLGLRARSHRPDVLPHVGELQVRVAVPVAVRLDLVPQVQRVSGRARFTAVVRNDGALPVRVRLESGDTDAATQLKVRRQEVTVAAGGRATTKVVATATTPWGGPEPERLVTLRALVGGEQVEALGSFVQRTRTGTAALAASALLVVLAVVLIVALVGG